MSYEIVHKKSFSNQLRALPPSVIKQVLDKIEVLTTAPEPDSKNKKRLTGYRGQVFRIRSGDYRVLYTYRDGLVTLLGVDHRKDVYDRGELVAEPARVHRQDVPETEDMLAPLPDRSFPVDVAPVEPVDVGEDLDPINLELLERLKVPAAFTQALLACRTVEDLIKAEVPAATRDAIFDAVTTPNYDDVLQQPDYVTGDLENLRRFSEGELITFLLKLDPEQERYVRWALRGSGPTLVKGGPGTGKSTVALYSVRALVKSLQDQGVVYPRVLVTTYTNALVSYSRDLLEHLLGSDVHLVDVRTADSVAVEVVGSEDGRPEMADDSDLRRMLRQAISRVRSGDPAYRDALERLLGRLGEDYLLDEIGQVITGRSLRATGEYLATSRAGRRVPLTEAQRTLVWRLYAEFEHIRNQSGFHSWHSLRRRAAKLVADGTRVNSYDAVVVDEAQDLDPTVLRMLLGMCKTPDRLFVTADANQTIYGNGFRWADVHRDLRFQGRTATLRTNHRSTREIAEAARSYLYEGVIDEDGLEATTNYVLTGPRPTAQSVASLHVEAREIIRFLIETSRDYHLGLEACAILVPTAAMGKKLATMLNNAGIRAEYMAGRELDLSRPVVKLVTLQSSKGLEFPIVGIAGFSGAPYPGLRSIRDPDELAEALDVARRTLYVAMTRAMRGLLLLVPTALPRPMDRLLDGFDDVHWRLSPVSQGVGVTTNGRADTVHRTEQSSRPWASWRPVGD